MPKSDHSQLSLQQHELDYILKKLGKRETKENRLILCGWEIEFKAGKGGQATKSYTKDEFYLHDTTQPTTIS